MEQWPRPVEDLVRRPDFWRGKRVLITGHTGFKGGWLSLWLQQAGAELIGYSLAAPTRPSLFELAGIARGMRSLEGDVRDLQRLDATIREHRPEIVLHLAAQPLVRESYRDPVSTYATNVMGTVHLLEAVRRAESVRAVVVVTSDKCYENREWASGYRENEAMGGFDPYSSSKGCAELVTAAYRNSFFTGGAERGAKPLVASTRAGNVIGGGDWADDRLVPDVVRAFAAGRAVIIRNPHAIRPWQHALEPLHGYLMLAERLYNGEASFAEGWNFGPHDADTQSVSWIVQRLADAWGNGAAWVSDSRENPHEAHHLKLDCSKARNVLGWTPKLAIDAAIEWTVEWYRCHRAGGDLRRLTHDQIVRYQSLS